jgi:acetyl-CoA acyltransferase
MLTGIIPATKKVLERAGLTIDDLDAYEMNEAFASVPLAWQKELGAAPDKLNSRGGAIAFWHPLGACGTRLLGWLRRRATRSACKCRAPLDSGARKSMPRS